LTITGGQNEHQSCEQASSHYGVGIKPVEYVFKDISTGKPSHTPISVGGKEYKTNIGAAAALECARAGAVVHLVARTESKLLSVAEWIKENIPSAQVEYSVLDLNDLGAMQKMVGSIPDGIPLYWVQSVGLGVER